MTVPALQGLRARFTPADWVGLAEPEVGFYVGQPVHRPGPPAGPPCPFCQAAMREGVVLDRAPFCRIVAVLERDDRGFPVCCLVQAAPVGTLTFSCAPCAQVFTAPSAPAMV